MQVYKCDHCGCEVRGPGDLYRDICTYCKEGKLDIVLDWWDFTSPYDRRVTVVRRPHEEKEEGIKETPDKKEVQEKPKKD